LKLSIPLAFVWFLSYFRNAKCSELIKMLDR